MDLLATIADQTLAVWLQALSSTIVLFLIYWQLRQVKEQMSQMEEHTKFQRSWEFLQFYQDAVQENELLLRVYQETFDPMTADVQSEAFEAYRRNFFEPRVPVFRLLNQLISFQQVDERMLFGYLEEDFNRFLLIGLRQYGPEAFKKQVGAHISLLLTAWGAQVQARALLYGAAPMAMSVVQSTAHPEND